MVTLFSQKKENSTKLKKSLGLLLKFKPLWLIKITNLEIQSKLIECLKELPAWFVVYSDWLDLEVVSSNIVLTWSFDELLISWFDFIVCDENIENLNMYIEKGITPVINKDNHMSTIFTEFNPLKNEWNAFFYNNNNKNSIFYTIIRYMENYKFPYDNKNLVKNVLNVL